MNTRTECGILWKQTSTEEDFHEAAYQVFLCLALLLGGIFRYFHPTHASFNDRFVLGNTAAEIVARYGEFDRIYEDNNRNLTKAEYMIRNNTPELIMSYDNSLWYEIYFQDGVAIKVSLQEGYIGG